MKEFVHWTGPRRYPDSAGMVTSEFAVGTLGAATIAGAAGLLIRPEVMTWYKNLLALFFAQISTGLGFS